MDDRDETQEAEDELAPLVRPNTNERHGNTDSSKGLPSPHSNLKSQFPPSLGQEPCVLIEKRQAFLAICSKQTVVCPYKKDNVTYD